MTWSNLIPPQPPSTFHINAPSAISIILHVLHPGPLCIPKTDVYASGRCRFYSRHRPSQTRTLGVQRFSLRYPLRSFSLRIRHQHDTSTLLTKLRDPKLEIPHERPNKPRRLEFRENLFPQRHSDTDISSASLNSTLSSPPSSKKEEDSTPRAPQI